METSWARVTSDPSRKVYADHLSAEEWRTLQTSYRVGELVMPCCEASAIPKTSPLGLQFFAHASGECGTAPMTAWHRDAQAAVMDAANSLGLRAEREFSVDREWIADVWIDAPRGPVVVELQHSYQHLRDFVRRQERYRLSGICCLWLLPRENYARVFKPLAYRAKAQWRPGDGVLLPDVPMAGLELEESPRVFGTKLASPLAPALASFCAGRWEWVRGCWLMDGVRQYPVPSRP
ncbi:hypothetical protein [Paracidovorax citrulli]|uniref:competence protein CoiA family protein n=1 Tax=Paracidovorax citrulli TaxID=80869 RepID=UPI000A79F526|nr:hypothetical protein [Paracidovorax citrulli]